MKKFTNKDKLLNNIVFVCYNHKCWAVDADITIFGGDLNATPIDNMHQPYGMLRYCISKKSCPFTFPSK